MKSKKRNIKWNFILVILMIIVVIVCFLKANKYNFNENLILEKESMYDASKEIEVAKERVKDGKRAEVLSKVNSNENKIALNFEGLAEKSIMDDILKILKQEKIKSTFFITGIEAGEDIDTLSKIKSEGHSIGSLSLSGKTHMEELDKTDLISDFCRSNKIINVVTKQSPVLLKCNSTIYTPSVLEAAYASENTKVVETTNYINYQSFKSYEETYNYIKNLSKGSILSIKVKGVLDEFEYNINKNEKNPAIDKKPDLNENKGDIDENIDIIQIVKWLVKAIKDNEIDTILTENINTIKSQGSSIEENLSLIQGDEQAREVIPSNNEIKRINFKDLIAENQGKLASVNSKIYTTQPALSYTFRGLSDENVLNTVLNTLDELSCKGTFFVTKSEIEHFPDRIKNILSKGHEIANGGITVGSQIMNKSVEEICLEIYEVDNMLKNMGIHSNAYMAGYGYSSEAIQEAVATIKLVDGLKDYEFFTYSKAPIISKFSNMDINEILANYLPINTYLSLQKGEIVYFRLDSDVFSEDNMVADLIKAITLNYVKNGYVYRHNSNIESYEPYITEQVSLGYDAISIKSIQDSGERYNLNFKDNILETRDEKQAVSMFKNNYIGNRYVNLDTFKEEEKKVMDKTGTINTNGEDVIFFTFDDWGGDPILNRILNVLDKHGVKGSFFVIAKNTEIDGELSSANPNLLRTIAIKDHDIGSHNYYHETLDADKGILMDSIPKSYESMWKVIGDLSSLRPYFRQPKLIVNREGLEAVFQSGLDYAVGGNISTHDYEADSALELVKSIEEGLISGVGNIVIMHMSNQSYYTPEALDIFLTNNENGVYGKKYKIAKLSDYLKNGYEQNN